MIVLSNNTGSSFLALPVSYHLALNLATVELEV